MSQRCPVWDYDKENLTYSAKALKNSVTSDMWMSIENDLPQRLTGPEVFKAIVIKNKSVVELALYTWDDVPGKNLKNVLSTGIV